MSLSTRNDIDEFSVFCVAAILFINRQKIMRETYSIDDVIKMFNDNMLKINVKRCIRMAIKPRKKYFYKLIKQTSLGCSEQKNINAQMEALLLCYSHISWKGRPSIH